MSSPAALLAHPPPDGIALRAAILATNNAAGTLRITFSPRLTGQTIILDKFLPAFERDGVSVVGLVGADGRPAVTIDGVKVARPCCAGLLSVHASDVAIQHLRIVHAQLNFINVHADEPGGPKVIRNVRIEDNDFEDNMGSLGVGLSIGMEFPGNEARTSKRYVGAVDAALSHVTVARNTFRLFSSDAINVQSVGTNGLIEDVVIDGNVFSEISGRGSPAIELDNTLAGNRIVGARITRNNVTASWAPIHVNGGIGYPDRPTSGNVIRDMVISGNEFRGNEFGTGFTAGIGNATGNAVLNTEISNNLMTGSAGAIDIAGGATGATENRVEGVRMASNTIAYNDGGIVVRPDRDGGRGNSVGGIEIRDSIFWMNTKNGDFFGPTPMQPEQVSSSITTAPGFAGRNGDVSVDPLFVDPAGGNFRLQPGSPATGKGYVPGG